MKKEYIDGLIVGFALGVFTIGMIIMFG